MSMVQILAATNIGNNFFNLILDNGKPIVWVLIIVSGVYFMAKRETSKLIAWLCCSILGVVMVYNTAGFTEKLLEFGNKILGLK